MMFNKKKQNDMYARLIGLHNYYGDCLKRSRRTSFHFQRHQTDVFLER
jgi:hypothetical protein